MLHTRDVLNTYLAAFTGQDVAKVQCCGAIVAAGCVDVPVRTTESECYYRSTVLSQFSCDFHARPPQIFVRYQHFCWDGHRSSFHPNILCHTKSPT
jgi:hypothetical protein